MGERREGSRGGLAWSPLGPAKAGTRGRNARKNWIPAFAGMSGRGRNLLVTAAQFVHLLLHFGELAPQLVEIAAGRSRRRGLLFTRRLLVAPRKRREHREGALEHFHIAADLLVERPE